MVGEIVPLLTSPGRLGDKLRLVAHRLSVGAGYDIVRFNIPSIVTGDGATTTFARLEDGLVERWDAAQPGTARPLSEQLRESHKPILISDVASSDRYTDEQREILRALGEAALAEHVEWAVMHRQRPLEAGKM
jgi:hypothetical protein